MKRFEFVAEDLFVAVVGMESWRVECFCVDDRSPCPCHIGAVTLQINTMSAHHFGKVLEFM